MKPVLYSKLPKNCQSTVARGALIGMVAAMGCARMARAGDVTMWGMTPHRNMVSAEKNPPTDWEVADPDKHTPAKNIKWSAALGSKAYGNPIIVNGMVIVGTNNEAAYDKKYTNPDGSAIDGGVLMAFDEQTGKFLWQRYSAKLAAGRVNDWPGEGLCSTVYAESGRIWFCTNRCEVICADVTPQGIKDVWSVDMMAKHGVYPHNMTASSIVSWGDNIYLMTGNGVDDNHKTVVAPQAPGIICFNKNTGEKIWSDNSPAANVLHGQWASVALADVQRADGSTQTLVIAPMGDAWVRAFDAKTGKTVWTFDANLKNSIYPQTRNEIIATPVIIDNKKMYIATGQDPEHSTGNGRLWCVDITRTGDISGELPVDPTAPKPKVGDELINPVGAVPNRAGKPNPNSGVIWQFFTSDDNGDGKIDENERFHRSISTVAVSNGLVFEGDYSGYLHCLDANTGKHYWAHDMEADIWGSPIVIDGKVYIGDGDGKVSIFEASKEAKDPIAQHNMGHPVYSTPMMANGTLFVLSMNKLYAIQEKK